MKVRFGKIERDLGTDIASVRDWVRSRLGIDDVAGEQDLLIAIGLAKALRAGNIASLVGKTVTIDLDAVANLVRIT